MNRKPADKLRAALLGGLSALLIAGMFCSVRMAQADYEASEPVPLRVQRACRLAPGSAQYWLKAARLRDVEAPEDPEVEAGLRHALALNPRCTDAWISLAFRNEIHGRVTEAEHSYLAATGIDHMYKPAWALTNFYLRHPEIRGARDQFWRWARKCLEVVEPRRLEPASYNPAPVFDLAWQVTADAGEIRGKLIPPRHFILADYLEYLADRNRTDAGADVAIDLAGYADPDDKDSLLRFCNRLIDLGKGGRAMEIWNALADRGTLRSGRLDPRAGRSMTNADLRRPFESTGFDWRMPPAEGVAQNHFTQSGECRFDFSGGQPEDVLLLYQNVPVVPGTAYRLTFRYRTSRMEQTDGLSWQVLDYADRRYLPVTCRLSPHAEWARGEAAFTTPATASTIRLALVYQRATGSTRIRGIATFAAFALELASRVDGDSAGSGSK